MDFSFLSHYVLLAICQWDTLNGNINGNTIEIAKSVMDNIPLFGMISPANQDLIKCIAAGNPDYPPNDEAKVILDEIRGEI